MAAHMPSPVSLGWSRIALRALDDDTIDPNRFGDLLTTGTLPPNSPWHHAVALLAIAPIEKNPFVSRVRRRMNRRQFIKTAAGAAALTAVNGCNPATASASTAGRTFIGAADSYKADLVSIIDAGLREFPNFNVAGKSVLLKPNLVETSESDRPINTHPAVVIAAAEAIRRAGASKITVADGPGHRRDTELVLAQSGLGVALREAGSHSSISTTTKSSPSPTSAAARASRPSTCRAPSSPPTSSSHSPSSRLIIGPASPSP